MPTDNINDHACGEEIAKAEHEKDNQRLPSEMRI
jgi:hypothetical protein